MLRSRVEVHKRRTSSRQLAAVHARRDRPHVHLLRHAGHHTQPVIRDLAKDSAKVYDGRKVASQRDELAYKIEARGEGAFEAVLVADVREGVLLPGGIDGTVAVWKGGAFTGLVLLPVPTSLWKAVGREHSVARLEDPAGDIMGPCRLVTPDEAAWALAQI